MNNLLPYNYRV